MSAPQAVLDLIEHFERNLDDFKSGRFSEEHLRLQFLNPLFGRDGLGWDIYNDSRYAEAYKDVIHEDALRIGEGTKAPDYCFRIGGTRKFFLEAKKPSVDIRDDVAPAYQLRRYAWTAKLPLSVLSDFEEFAIYDCRIKPRPSDKASAARIFYCTYRELPEKWDYIASIFSREAVLKGSFDKFAAENKAKRGTAEVDADFLEEIERWRKELAQNLALRNPKLTQRELNFAIQRIIDRIIFLRIAEDRGLENYGKLLALTNGARIYPRLCELFEAADARYNSGLFHFKRERDRHEAPDELTLRLDIDDKLLKDILKSLYYPDSPYAFSVLSADILGQVYEQFLGKVITLTEGHRAKVEDKPEVKKAGGVYYTPTYIVDYIVRETVGKLLEGIVGANGSGAESPGAVSPHPGPLPRGEGTASAAPSEFTSPSRASSATPSPGNRNAILPLPEGEGRGEGEQTSRPPAALNLTQPPPQAAAAVLQRVAKLRIVDPACGSGSFLIGAYQFLLDWHLAFYTANDPARWAREVTRARRGGGVKLKAARHPVLVQTRAGGWQLSIAERKRILLDNIYGVDIDAQAVEVTKLSLLLKVLEGDVSLAQLSFGLEDRVLPDLGDNIKCGNSLIGPDFYAQPDLPVLTDEERFRINVFDWRAEFPEVFKAGGFDAVIGNPPWGAEFSGPEKAYLITLFVNRRGEAESHLFFIEKGVNLLNDKGRLGFITPNTWLTVRNSEETREHILKTSSIYGITELSKYIFRDAPDIVPIIFAAGKKQGTETRCIVRRATVNKVTSGNFPQVFIESHIDQAFWNQSKGRVINLRADTPTVRVLGSLGRKSVLLSEICDVVYGIKTGGNARFVSKERTVHHTVRALKTGELGRYSLRWKNFWLWWSPQLAGYRESRVDVPKIVVQYIRKLSLPRRIVAALDEQGLYYPLNNYSYITVKNFEHIYSIEFVLGVLNSTAMNFFFANTFIDYNIKPTYLQQLPVRRIDAADTQQLHLRDSIAALVTRMLDLHRQRADARTPQEQANLDREIKATDARIDRLVYELYGLTEDEIRIVEGASASAASEPAEPAAAPAAPLPQGQSTPQSEGDAAHYYFFKEPPPKYS